MEGARFPFLTPDIPPNLFNSAYIVLKINRLDEVGENFIFGVDICDALYHALCRPQRERMNVSLASTDLSIKALGF